MKCVWATMMRLWLVSGGGHMNSRNQGFPAEYHTVLRWSRLFIFNCQCVWLYLILWKTLGVFSQIQHVFIVFSFSSINCILICNLSIENYMTVKIIRVWKTLISLHSAPKAPLEQVQVLNFWGVKGTQWTGWSGVAEEEWKYGWVYEPYSRAVMVLMEEVEQRVRSPQHLCGRLMTTEPWEGETDRHGEKLRNRPRPVQLTQRSDPLDLCQGAATLPVCALLSLPLENSCTIIHLAKICPHACEVCDGDSYSAQAVVPLKGALRQWWQ